MKTKQEIEKTITEIQRMYKNTIFGNDFKIREGYLD